MAECTYILPYIYHIMCLKKNNSPHYITVYEEVLRGPVLCIALLQEKSSCSIRVGGCNSNSLGQAHYCWVIIQEQHCGSFIGMIRIQLIIRF